MGSSKVKLLLLCFVVAVTGSQQSSTAAAGTDVTAREFVESTTTSLANTWQTLGDTSDNARPEKSPTLAKTIDLVCPYNHSDHILYVRWYKVFGPSSVRMLKRKDVSIASDADETVGNATKVSLIRARDFCDGVYVCSVWAKVGHVNRHHGFIVSNCTVSRERVDSPFRWADGKRLLAANSTGRLDAFVVFVVTCAIGLSIY